MRYRRWRLLSRKRPANRDPILTLATRQDRITQSRVAGGAAQPNDHSSARWSKGPPDGAGVQTKFFTLAVTTP